VLHSQQLGVEDQGREPGGNREHKPRRSPSHDRGRRAGSPSGGAACGQVNIFRGKKPTGPTKSVCVIFTRNTRDNNF